MSCTLSTELKAKHCIKGTLPVKRGDTVTIMSGHFKNQSGQVLSVNHKTYRLKISRIEKERPSGQNVTVPIHYSNCKITKLKAKDPMREKIINRKVVKVTQSDESKPLVSSTAA